MSTCFLELSFSLISPINSREEPCSSELTCEQRSLADYSPWGHKESDMTEHACIHTHTHTHTHVNYYRAVAYRLKLYIMAHLWKPCFPHNEH